MDQSPLVVQVTRMKVQPELRKGMRNLTAPPQVWFGIVVDDLVLFEGGNCVFEGSQIRHILWWQCPSFRDDFEAMRLVKKHIADVISH